MFSKYVQNVRFNLSLSTTSKSLIDKNYLKSVKNMEYPQFLNIMKTIAPDIEASNQLLNNHQTSEYIVFSNTVEEDHLVCEMNDEYPICIIQKDGVFHFQGISPFTLHMILPTKVIYLPTVIDLEGIDYAHQMTFIIDFHENIAFVHDPNGSCSRYFPQSVRDLFVAYVDSINHVMDAYSINHLTFIDIPNQARMNYELKGIGAHHCVVASIAYMLAYMNIGSRDTINEALCHTSKKEHGTIYIALYNLIGACIAADKADKN